MSIQSQEYLARLLKEYSNQSELEDLNPLLTSAMSGLTQGANEFVEQISKTLQPNDLKNAIQCYPMAHVLVGMIKFYELNKDTRILRELTNSLLDSLEIDKENNTLH